MTRRTWGSLAGAVLLALVLAACRGDDTGGGETTLPDDAEPRSGGTLVFGLASETSGFNPAEDQITLSGYQITNAVYDRLVAYDEDAQARPYLAESLEPNEDFTEWTITLRPGISFHDGTPLDAEILAMNLQATKDSVLLGQVFRAVERIEAVHELAVLVTMSTPWSSFPHTLTAQPGLIVAPSVLEEPDGGQRPVGTGPFEFDSWTPDQRLVVVRNDDYWRDGYPLLDQIEFRIIPDEVTRLASLESGDIHIMEVRNGAQIAELERRDPHDVVVYLDDEGETTEDVLFFNTAVDPFDDPRARAAVAHAVDREQISEILHGGRFPPADGPFKDASPWYREVGYPDHDPDRARDLVEEYEADTGQPLEFSLLTGPGPTSREFAALLQQQLQAVGISISIEPIEATEAIVKVLGGDFQASSTNALFGSTHPDREYTFLHSDNAFDPGEGLGTAFTRVRSERIDAGLDAARATGDRDEQADAWGEVQEGLAEELGFLFLVHDEVGVAASPDVRDVVRWTLPDGTPGLAQEQNVVSVYQLWLAD